MCALHLFISVLLSFVSYHLIAVSPEITAVINVVHTKLMMNAQLECVVRNFFLLFQINEGHEREKKRIEEISILTVCDIIAKFLCLGNVSAAGKCALVSSWFTSYAEHTN